MVKLPFFTIYFTIFYTVKWDICEVRFLEFVHHLGTWPMENTFFALFRSHSGWPHRVAAVFRPVPPFLVGVRGFWTLHYPSFLSQKPQDFIPDYRLGPLLGRVRHAKNCWNRRNGKENGKISHFLPFFFYHFWEFEKMVNLPFFYHLFYNV